MYQKKGKKKKRMEKIIKKIYNRVKKINSKMQIIIKKKELKKWNKRNNGKK